MSRVIITPKQRKYAYNIMNTETTKQDAMLDAGYTESMSRNPSKVEQSVGFQLAMASIFAKTGNVAMALLNEIQTRDMTKESTEDIVKFFDVMTKAMERMTPKKGKEDSDLTTIMAYVIDDDVPALDKDSNVLPLDNEDIALHSDDTQQDTELDKLSNGVV